MAGKSAGRAKAVKSPAEKKAEEDHRAALMQAVEMGQQREVALERVLALRMEQIERSRLESADLRRQLVALDAKFVDEKRMMDATAQEMYRQYRAMQALLLERVEDLQQTIGKLREEHDAILKQIETTTSELDAQLADRNRTLAAQKQRMEDMASDFGDTLKHTLERMSHSVASSHPRAAAR